MNGTFAMGSRSGRRDCADVRGRVRVLVCTVVLVAACGKGDVPVTSLESARQLGLRVGFAIEPPFAFVDAAGEVRGEAPSVMRYAAAALEIDSLQWFPLQFDNLMPALLQAVRAYAKLGEIDGVCREVYGEYLEPAVV